MLAMNSAMTRRKWTNLAIIKCAIYSKVMHVGIHDSGHLSFLDRADFTVRVHYEDRHIFLAAQSINGRRASIATCRTNNSQMFPIATNLVLIPAYEEVLKQVP